MARSVVHGEAGARWSTRAHRLNSVFGRARRDEPFLARLLGERATSYIDIGAGTGRYAIPLARAGRRVIAVEPSAGMRAVLGTAPRLTVVADPWPVDAGAGDVAFAAYVLYLIPRAAPFLEAMTRSATRARYVALAGIHSDAAFDPLWRHFHGRSRATNPTFFDTVELLRELGVRPTLEMVRGSGGARYATVAEAVVDLRENLCLPPGAEIGRELRSIARGWLIHGPGGLRLPGVPPPLAVIRW